MLFICLSRDLERITVLTFKLAIGFYKFYPSVFYIIWSFVWNCAKWPGGESNDSCLCWTSFRPDCLHCNTALSLSNILQQNFLHNWIHFATEVVPQDFWLFIPSNKRCFKRLSLRCIVIYLFSLNASEDCICGLQNLCVFSHVISHMIGLERCIITKGAFVGHFLTVYLNICCFWQLGCPQ